MIRRIQQGLLVEGIEVSVAKLCAWFGIPRRMVYYKPVKAAPKVDTRFSEPIKKMIEEEPSFGYRTVAWLLGFNKNTMQRIFQIKGWQVRKRPVGRHAPPHSSRPVSRRCAERALVDRSHSHLDGQGRLGIAGPGDRLPHA